MSPLFKFRYVLFTMLLLPLQSCAVPFWYSAEPIEGWVADAETNQPIEGVIVTANWQLKGGLEGGNPVGQMMVMETVTDKIGHYYFPGWGPKLRPWNGKLKDESPQILMFKSGYSFAGLENKLTMEVLRGELENPLRSDWTGETIKMGKFRGTQKEYKELFEDFNHTLERIATDQPTDCHWKNLQKTIRAMNQERNRLVTLGTNPNTLSSIDNELLMNDKFYTEKGGCGSPKKFFGEFKQ
ncbi:MAG: hypothetical protein K8F27_09785 [Sulfuricellaceae bacterium]|nr:hypothetical protein [Sulfuricellaceae bacterium]